MWLVASTLHLDLATAQRIARLHNTSLEASRLALEASRLALAKARAQRYVPTLDLGVTLPSVREYVTQQVDPQTGALTLFERESRTLSADLALRVPLPTDGLLKLSLGGQRWEDAPREGRGGWRPMYTNSVGLSLEQPLGGGASAPSFALEQAELTYRLALATYQREQEEVDFRVAMAFMAAVRAHEQALIDSLELQVAIEYSRLGQRKLASGLLSRGDALDLMLREATVRADYLTSLAAKAQATEDLLSVLGLDLSTPVELVKPPPPPSAKISLAKAIHLALERRSEVVASRLRERLARSRLAQVRQNRWPSLTISYATDLVHRGSSWEPAWREGRREQTLRIGLAFPLLSVEAGSQVAQASLALDQERTASAQAQHDIEAEVRSAVRGVETAQERVRLLEQALTVAEEHFQVASARFESGTINSQQLLDAQLALFRARTNLLGARVDLEAALRRLQKVTHARLDEVAESP